MTEMARGAVDKVLEKVVSRKLLVWATATALMFNATIDSGDWLILSCLLYTSPSPRDRTRSRMPSSA